MTQDTIKYDFWLAFDYTGSSKGPVPRVTKGEPQTGRGERAVRCTATLPLSLFATPSVSLTIDVDAPDRPDIEAGVRSAADVFKDKLGVDVDLVIHPVEAEEPTEPTCVHCNRYESAHVGDNLRCPGANGTKFELA